MKKLFLIPARGGSKGLPRKNILPLAGKPMIKYSIDAALAVMTSGDELCISTDNLEIKRVAEECGVEVPFLRPRQLATDEASSEDVIKHTLMWYKGQGRAFDVVVLLQVTSPLRTAKHINEALALFNQNLDLVTSVKESHANPYFVLHEENKKGYLEKSKKGVYSRRQDCPPVYELNGAIYIINVKSLNRKKLSDFTKIKKYTMSKEYSVDIDDKIDFIIAEYLLNNMSEYNSKKSDNLG